MPQSRLLTVVTAKLFSDDYVRNRLPQRPDYRKMAPDREKLDRVIAIYQRAGRLLESANEMQIRGEVIDPILTVLDHHFLADQPLQTGRTPDYTFYRDAKGKLAKDAGAIVAVGDAKEPGKDFVRVSGERSPVMQVYDYMIDSQSRWGILTDGRRWRLLNRDSPSDAHLEIDLYEVSRSAATDDWLLFYNLFRREAFVAGPDGKCFLDTVKEHSTKYSRAVGEELKERVYDALRELATGFAAWPENALDASKPEVREQIRTGCFVLLYRLLFIFYAEANGLLPIDDEGYRRLSLETIRERVKGASRDGSHLLSDTRATWASLRDLFRLIDEGRREPGIAPYDGGLFARSRGHSPAMGSFLDKYDIADRYLARAIDLIGTAPSFENPRDFVNIDYRGLQIRHLGSIYEGLLEYRLGYAESDLVSVQGRIGEIWIPAKDYSGKQKVEKLPSERRVKAGELYLETERHERKVSGSYYTPDYVVKYIVRSTLGPLVERAKQEAKRDGRRRSEGVLSLKVCDPAMGSGHFLVEATEFLASEFLKAVADDLQDGFVTDDEYSEDRARREVVTHCIYGVDVNPLAVELAKVSLWLSTVSRDKPLSFLDHRLKCGNSLLGARLIDLRQYPRPEADRAALAAKPDLVSFIPPYYVETLVSKMREVEALAEETVEETKAKAHSYDEFRSAEAYIRTRGCADAWMAIQFGVRPPGNDPAARYYDVLSVIDRGDQQWAERTRAPWFKLAVAEAQHRCFFHWELEFPEVFLGKDRPGFDAVLGNPPYVRIYRQQLAEADVDYFLRRFETAHKKFDLYVLFMEQATRLTRQGGLWSFIVPDKFLFTPYGERLRDILLRATVRQIIDLRTISVFDAATVSNVIVVVEATAPPDGHAVQILRASTPEGLLKPDATGLTTISQATFAQSPGHAFRLDLTPTSFPLVSRIEDVSFRLEDLCYVNWGLRTGTTEKTSEMIVKAPSSPRHKPMIWGEDIVDRYSLRFSGWYIDYDPDRLYNPMFPALFEGEKIVVRKISGPKGLMSAVDRGNHYCFSTVIVAKPQLTVPQAKRTRQSVPPEFSRHSLSYITAVVNSRLMAYYYRITLSDQLSVVPNHVKVLPIKRIFHGQPEASLDPDECERLLDAWLKQSPWTATRVADFIRAAPALQGAVAIHDLLTCLADWMMSRHDEVNSEVRGFLTWLGTELGAEIPALAGRSLLERYFELPFTDFLSVLRKNRKKLRTDPRARSVQERLRREFEKSSGQIQGALAKIAGVDLLVDHLVYRLYGLSSEEVAIVEASGT